MNRDAARQRLSESRLYGTLQLVNKFLDRYYLDGVVGLLPFGMGDWFTAAISLVYVYFGAFVVKSGALSIAMAVNIVRDIMLGLLPFGVGNVIDFFHRSNQKNIRLVEGFVDGDEAVIRDVQARKRQGIITLIAMLLVIVALVWLVVFLGSKLFAWIS